MFADEEGAARAYDRALVRLRGNAAATNYRLADYETELAEHAQAEEVRGAGLNARRLRGLGGCVRARLCAATWGSCCTRGVEGLLR